MVFKTVINKEQKSHQLQFQAFIGILCSRSVVVGALGQALNCPAISEVSAGIFSSCDCLVFSVVIAWY